MIRSRRQLRVFSAALVAAGLSAHGAAPAQETAPAPAQTEAQRLEREREERQRQLQSIGQDIRTSEERTRRIQAEIETLRRDREEVTRRTVETARAMQRLEGQAAAGDARLAELAREEDVQRRALAGRRAVMAEVLAALQRLGRNPPPAIVVEPEGALGAVRSAILLGAVLPELSGEAQKLVETLEQLAGVRRRIATEVEEQRTRLATLADERTRLDLLQEERRRSLQASEEELVRTRTRAEQLARDARSLQDLVRRMEQDLTAARRAADAAARAEAERLTQQRRREEEDRALLALREVPNTADRTVAALPNPGRTAPAVAFDRTRGLLPRPVSGERVRAFGDDDGVGGTHRGESLVTPVEATVTAPADGWIVYAGPFRSYGSLVIVNVGGGFHVLLAGMETVTVDAGQFVLAGEPVGRMGRRSLAAATAIDIGSERPVLYVEFRKDGTTVDPGPWWATTAVERARG